VYWEAKDLGPEGVLETVKELMGLTDLSDLTACSYKGQLFVYGNNFNSELAMGLFPEEADQQKRLYKIVSTQKAAGFEIQYFVDSGSNNKTSIIIGRPGFLRRAVQASKGETHDF
jgi:hypothetical protein